MPKRRKSTGASPELREVYSFCGFDLPLSALPVAFEFVKCCRHADFAEVVREFSDIGDSGIERSIYVWYSGSERDASKTEVRRPLQFRNEPT